MKKILGIDPGLSGGITLLAKSESTGSDVILMTDIMPIVKTIKTRHDYDEVRLVNMIESCKPDHVVIEKTQSMPGQGVRTCWSIGLGYGLLRGMVAMAKIPYTLVHPKTWQGMMFRDMPKENTKKMSYIVCSRLWPHTTWLATERCKKPHDGMMDSALIALYGMRTL